MGWWLGISASEGNVSIANNTSVVTVTLAVGWNGGSWAGDNPSWGITIDGTDYSGTCNFNTGRASSGTQTVAICSKTVTHNSDGSKYVSYSGGYAGNGSGWQSTSGGITCQTIPRVSDLSISKSSCIAGSTQQSITVTPKASFTDTVVLSFGSKSYTIINSTGSSAKTGTYTVPLNWLTQIPNNLSGTVTVTLTTKSGSTVIGTKTDSFTLTCPSYEPTASRTLQPDSYISTFGSSRYVQLVTKVAGSITASGYNGSTISSIITSLEGITYTGSSFTSDWLSTSGQVTVTTVVTDSRGVTKTITGTITVIDYHYPQVQASVISNSSTSTASITVTGSVSPVSNLNAKRLKITWVNTSEQSGTVCDENLSSYDFSSGVTKTLSGIDPSMTYQFTVRVTDSVGYKEQVVVTGKPVISRHAGGDGVTFGEEASRSGFRVCPSWDAIIECSDGNDIDLRKVGGVPIGTIIPYVSNTIPSGWLKCNGASVSRTTYAALFSVIGTTYGSVDSSHFNLPDLQGRMPQGAGELGDEEYVLGDEVDAGVPNITGEFHHNASFSGSNSSGGVSGCVVKKTASSQYYLSGRGSGSGWWDWGIDASNSPSSGASDVYGNSTTVQPNTTVVVYIIKANSNSSAEPVEATIEQRIAAIEDDVSDLSKDYIVSKGTSGIWTYRKWNSGVAECFGKVNTGSMTSRGSGIYSVYKTFPVSFTEILSTSTGCYNTSSIGYYGSIDTWISAMNNGNCHLCAGTSISGIYATYHIVGKWK